MILRNNSKNEWLKYHNGIDIKAESTFEVSESDGNFILRLLGHENWVVEIKEEVKVEDVLKRQDIMKLLKKQGIKFSVSMKNDELMKLLK